MSSSARDKYSSNKELEMLFLDSMQSAVDKLSDEGRKKFSNLKGEDLQEMFELFINTVSDGFMQSVRKDKFWVRVRSKLYGVSFRRRLRKRWAGYVDEYELLIEVCIEAIARLRDNIGSSKDNDSHLGILIRLHARCLRISNEVLMLSMSGYGNAALARWRSLHEAAVTVAAIAKLGKQASDAFIAYNAIESHKAMLAFNEHALQLGEKKFAAREVVRAKKKRDDAVAKYGKQIESEFGWAELFTKEHKKGQFRFRELEKYYGSEFLRPYYRWSSYAVHTNIKTILTGEQSEALDNNGVLLTGASDKGFEDALQLSAFSLAYATVAVLTAYSNFENLAMAQAIIKYERKTSVTFSRYFQKNRKI
jgi:hypothetical protein